MGRAKPWYWADRKAWYVTLKKKQIRLADNEKDATREFYKLMAAEGKLEAVRADGITVAEACERFIDSVQHLRASTRRLYVDRLGPFAAQFRDARLDQLTPAIAVGFVTNYQGTGKKHTFCDSTRSQMFKHILMLYRWAKDTGLLATNPLSRFKNPWRVAVRNRPMTEAECQAILSDPGTSEAFRELFTFIVATGARPGEIIKIEARHLDARQPIARLQPTEHKTGTKTGRQREIYFPIDLIEILRTYAHNRPKGPLLRNHYGKPWNPQVVSHVFRESRIRLGLPEDCVLYMARHRFVTKLIESGAPLSRVSRLVGHTGTQITTSVYYHPETMEMLADVERLNTPPKTTKPEEPAPQKEADSTGSNGDDDLDAYSFM